MAYLVLARKYRPQNFKEVLGQRHVVKTLSNALKEERVAHALLFSGIRGTGKTTIARILAKALNCEKGPTPEPCNECQACLEITLGKAVDVLEIDAASNRGIDEIRELRENIRFMPVRLRSKVYIIDEAHMLTREAFNALLKTLEEPPSHAYFILATTEVHKIPVTILSRCQRYDFRRIPISELVPYLKDILQKEGLEIEEKALEIIAKEAEGSVRDALSLLDQAISSGVKTSQDLIEIFGLAEQLLIKELAKALLQQDLKNCFQLLDQAFFQGVELNHLAQELVTFFRNLLALKVSPSGILQKLPETELSTLRELSLEISEESLLAIFQILLEGAERMRKSPFPKLSLELYLAKACEVGKIVPLEELLKTLKKLRNDLLQISSEGSFGFSEKKEKVSNSWDNFLDFLKKESPSLASLLKVQGELEEIEGRLFLKIPENSLLADKEYKKELLSWGQKFFQKNIEISLISREKISTKQKLIEKPIVQEALRILGGRISHINIYNPKGGNYAAQYAKSHASSTKDAKKDG